MHPLHTAQIKVGKQQYWALQASARLITGMHAEEIEVDGLRVPYLQGGNGPPVLLVHGFNSDKESWLLTAGVLKRHYRLIIPDLPGYGEASLIPREEAGASLQAERLGKFLDALKIKAAHVVGHSMGGGISLRLAYDAPHRVRTLSLLCSPSPTHYESPFTKALKSGHNLLLPRTSSEYDQLLKLGFEKKPYFPSTIWAYLADRTIQKSEVLTELFHGWIDGYKNQQLPNDLETLQVPTHVLHGEADRIIALDSSRELAQRIPKAAFTMIRNVGHMPQVERPRKTGKALLSYLRNRH
ncbi:MAG: hypothetical protein CMH54_15095 [Myxococcales bacterium]|nr:hypothetical protein [Myxococcales bacterium]